MQTQDNWNSPAPDAASGTGRIVPPSEDAQQMPLNMLTGDSFDPGALGLGAEAERKGIPGPVLVLLVVCLVGGGALWVMRMAGGSEAPKDEAAVTAETKINQALERLAAAGKQSSQLSRDSIESLFQDADKVVALFANDPVKNQIALEDLSKNPFELPSAKSDDADVPAEVVDQARQERLRKLQDELAKLKLQSVLSGSRPLAVVSGEVVRVGSTVGSFTVETIGAAGVVLRAEGEAFDLKLPGPAEKSK